MGKTEQNTRVRGRLAAAFVLAAAALAVIVVLAPAALALPTFNQAQKGIGPCDSCHSQAQIHAVGSHASGFSNPPTSCTTVCHTSGSTANPPVPTVCAGCHGAANILAGTTHVATGCTTTPGCHGVAAAAPVVTSFVPGSGAVGATVTVNGMAFTGATAVTFNGVAATTFTVVSDIKITAKVPLGATSGTIAVTTPDGTGTSAGSFNVLIVSKVSIKLVGVTAGAIKVNKVLTVKGAVTPGHSAKVTITLQRKVGTKWVKMKVLSPMSNATTGAYSAKYKVTKKGAWRAMSSAAKTAAYTSAKTAWKTFKVK